MLALVVFYYLVNEPLPERVHHGFAPSIVSARLTSFYAVAYAVAACLAAWVGGRLRADGVWGLAPARSRAGVAGQALAPVVLVPWAVLVLPPALALGQAGVAPTPGTLPLVVTSMAVACAYTVVGFAAGTVFPRLIAAPVLAVGVYFVVATSWSSGVTFWPRHVLGQYPVELMFGELPTVRSLLPHVLFTGCLAVGLLIPLAASGRRFVATVLGLAVIAAGTTTAYALVSDWGPNPPLSTGNAPVACTGEAPEVCMPVATAGRRLPRIRDEAKDVLADLAAAGVVPDRPRRIADTVLSGRFSSTREHGTWSLPLTDTTDTTALRYQLTRQAIAPPCTHPGRSATQLATLWAAEITGTQKTALARQKEEAFTEAQRQRLARARETIADVLGRPRREQAAWFRDTLESACPSDRGTG